MALTFGFYDSSSGDRVYNALQMSSIFDGIILDGVFSNVGDALDVIESTGMEVTVSSGRAWFDHTWTYNDSGLDVTVDTADALLPRIDVVYLEVNKNSGVRANSIDILTGTPASSPVPPTLTKTSTIIQYALAHVYVGAGVTEIVQANITTKIGSEDTPYVKGPLINITTDDATIILDNGVLKVKDGGITKVQIANKTREIFVSALDLEADDAGLPGMDPATLIVDQTMGEQMQFLNNAVNVAYGLLPIPKDWNGGGFTVKLLWHADGTGNCVWGIDYKFIYDGIASATSFISTGLYPGTGYPASSTTSELKETTIGTSAIPSGSYPRAITFRIYRMGAAANDTLSVSAALSAMWWEYTANS